MRIRQGRLFGTITRKTDGRLDYKPMSSPKYYYFSLLVPAPFQSMMLTSFQGFLRSSI